MKKLITILLALSALASAKAEQSRYGAQNYRPG